MKKLKLLSTILLLALLISMFTMPVSALEEPTLGSNAVMLVDIATGNTIFSKNQDAQVYPASLTKIMTVLLAIEAVDRGECSLSDLVTAGESSSFDLIEDGSTANIVPGETMPLEDLMYCALVSSANEACNIIAQHISGSIPAFVEKMNAKAEELGCTGTHFTNTHGLPASNHYTTAQDMAKIALSAISHPKFMEICNTPEITIAATNVSEARRLVTTNGLLSQDAQPYSGYYYEAASGVKTGHTEAAGYCLISTAEKNGMRFLCVVMGGKATSNGSGLTYGNFTDTIALYNWAFENYSYRDILKMTDLVKDVPVTMGSEADYVSLHPQASVRALLPNDDNLESFIQRITIFSEEEGEVITAPVEAGQVLGEISIERDGVIYGTIPLVASSSIGLSYSQFISSRIVAALSNPLVIICLLIVLLLFAGYIFLVARYRLSRKKYLKAQQRRIREGAMVSRQREMVKNAPSAPRPKARAAISVPEPPSPAAPQTPAVDSQAERDYFEEYFGSQFDKK